MNATRSLRLLAALILIGGLTTASFTAPLQGQAATPEPAEVTFPSGDLQLRGFIWKPDGSGPFPALLWNHGSEKLPGWLPTVAPAFLAKGWAFFIPHRRGQGRSPGPYISDQLQAAKSPEERSSPSRGARSAGFKPCWHRSGA